MRYPKNSGCGRFITPSRLYTNESVLDNIDSAHTVFPRQSVKLQKDLNGVSDDFTVLRCDLRRETSGPFDTESFGLFGGFLRGRGQFPHVVGRGRVGVFQDTGFVRDVEEVLI